MCVCAFSMQVTNSMAWTFSLVCDNLVHSQSNIHSFEKLFPRIHTVECIVGIHLYFILLINEIPCAGSFFPHHPLQRSSDGQTWMSSELREVKWNVTNELSLLLQHEQFGKYFGNPRNQVCPLINFRQCEIILVSRIKVSQKH